MADTSEGTTEQTTTTASESTVGILSYLRDNGKDYDPTVQGMLRDMYKGAGAKTPTQWAAMITELLNRRV